jgi:hypothetical protein
VFNFDSRGVAKDVAHWHEVISIPLALDITPTQYDETLCNHYANEVQR